MQQSLPAITMSRGVILLTLALTYIIYSFTDLPISLFLISLVILAFAVSLPYMNAFPKYMSLLLIFFGNLIFFLSKGDGQYWVESVLNNVALVALFITVPLLSYPLKNGGYIEYVDQLVSKYLKSNIAKIAFITASTCVMSSFLNLGSLRVMYDLFIGRFGYLNKIFVRSLVQGFSLAAFWSPYFAGVAIIMHLAGVKFVSFLPYGLGMVIICYLVSIIINYLYISKEKDKDMGTSSLMAAGIEARRNIKPAQSGISHRKGIELFIAFIGLFLSLFLLEKWLHDQNVLILISILAIAYTFVWSLLIKKMKELAHSLKDYFKEVAPNVHTESIMIISATFFSQMVMLSDFPVILSSLFSKTSGISLILTILIIMFTCVIASFFIHQVLPISIFATTISPEAIGLKPELFVLTLIISWGITPLISPVSAANMIAASLFRTKPFEIGFLNMIYTIFIIFLSSFTIFLTNKIL
jgi:hypothetical protein